MLIEAEIGKTVDGAILEGKQSSILEINFEMSTRHPSGYVE